MKTDVDTCLKDIADWYVKNRRSMAEPELEAIVLKHCESPAEAQKFVGFLETEPGQLRFKTLLRERGNPPITSTLKEAPAAKEPWQMTLEEYAYGEARRLREAKPRIDWVKAGYGQYYRDHKASVKYALSKGKPVPPEVLKDYPDLQRKLPSAVIPTEEEMAKTLSIIDRRPKKDIEESKLRKEFGNEMIDSLRQKGYVTRGSAGPNPPLLVTLSGRETMKAIPKAEEWKLREKKGTSTPKETSVPEKVTPVTPEVTAQPPQGKLVQRSYRTPVGIVVDFGIQIGDTVYEPRASAVSPIGVSEAKKGWREVPAQERENYRGWEKKQGKFGNRARAIDDIEKRWEQIIAKGKTSQEHEKEQLASYESYMKRRAEAERQYSLKSSDLIVGMALEEIATGNRYVITEITDVGWVYARPENEPTQSGGSIGKGEVKGYRLAIQKVAPEVAIPKVVTPEVTAIAEKLATINLPNVKVTGSYAVEKATPESDIDLLVGIPDAEWDKITLYNPPDTVKKLYDTLPEDKMSIHLYKLSKPNELWHFQRPRVVGREHFSGVFLPVDYPQEMVQGLWKGAKSIEEVAIPKTRVTSLGFLELELPVARAVEALVEENPWSSGFHGALNQRWTIVFRGKVSDKAVKAAKAAGLEVSYREAPVGSGQILTDVSLPGVGISEIEKVTQVFNRFAELYESKPSYSKEGEMSTLSGATQAGKYRLEIGKAASLAAKQARVSPHGITRAQLLDILGKVPDVNDTGEINYWVDVGDKKVYIEGWCDKCIAGWGYPKRDEEGAYETFFEVGERLTPEIIERKASDNPFNEKLKLLEGGWVGTPNAKNLYGITWGVYKPV